MKKLLQILFTAISIAAGIAQTGYAANDGDECITVRNKKIENTTKNPDKNLIGSIPVKAIDLKIESIKNYPPTSLLKPSTWFNKSLLNNLFEKKNPINAIAAQKIKDDGKKFLNPFGEEGEEPSTQETYKNIVTELYKKGFYTQLKNYHINIALVMLVCIGIFVAMITTLALQLSAHCQALAKTHSMLTAWKWLKWLGYAPVGSPAIDITKLSPAAQKIRGAFDFFLNVETSTKNSMFNIFGSNTWGDVIGWTEFGIALTSLGMAGIFFIVLLTSKWLPGNKFEDNVEIGIEQIKAK